MQEIELHSLQLGSIVRLRLFPDVYYQSVIVLRPTLSRRQTMQLFARGPNVKKVVDNLNLVQFNNNVLLEKSSGGKK